jgi:arsenate reductase
MIAGGVYEVMDKRGIDISDQYSKGLEEIPIAEMDFVISLASFPADIVCPGDFAGGKLDWNIPDPYGARKEAFEKITNLIEYKLKNFIKENFKKKEL